jgi:hypothetical protein
MVHKVKIRTQSDRNCPVCESSQIEVFYEAVQMPIHAQLLWPEREDALSVPKGDIRLAFCPTCGHVFNAAYDPDLVKYNHWYENSLHFASRFQSYARATADRLIERYDLRKKDLIEIGSEQVDFLELVCDLGENRGIGFYPGYPDDPGLSLTRQRVTFMQNVSTDQYPRYQADLICCRGLLERLYKPREFVNALRRDIGDKHETIGFIEVSNCFQKLRNFAIWDVAYEDFSCFTPTSLEYLISNNGFEIIERGSARNEELLTVDFRPRVEDRPVLQEPDPGSLESIRAAVQAFQSHFSEVSQQWKARIEEWKAGEKKAVLWGVGPRENTFLNALKLDDSILHVVDFNPRNRGLHIAGSGHRIVSPVTLRSLRPDVLIILDAATESEIRQIVSSLDLTPEFLSG